jgi:hypothetical protein
MSVTSDLNNYLFAHKFLTLNKALAATIVLCLATASIPGHLQLVRLAVLFVAIVTLGFRMVFGYTAPDRETEPAQ